MKKDEWVNRKYTKERVTLSIEANIFYRIKRHRKELLVMLRKEIKHLDLAGGNIKVVKVK